VTHLIGDSDENDVIVR